MGGEQVGGVALSRSWTVFMAAGRSYAADCCQSRCVIWLWAVWAHRNRLTQARPTLGRAFQMPAIAGRHGRSGIQCVCRFERGLRRSGDHWVFLGAGAYSGPMVFLSG